MTEAFGGQGLHHHISNPILGHQESLALSSSEFNLYELFDKGGAGGRAKQRGTLGIIYKVKFYDEEKTFNCQMLCRVIKFDRVKNYVIEDIFKEYYSQR
jgi:hypothetical protein